VKTIKTKTMKITVTKIKRELIKRGWMGFDKEMSELIKDTKEIVEEIMREQGKLNSKH